MLFQDASSGKNLYRKFVKNETNRDYFVLQRLMVINTSQCYHKVEKSSFLIANQMQLIS